MTVAPASRRARLDPTKGRPLPTAGRRRRGRPAAGGGATFAVRMDDLVTVAAYMDVPEAELAKERLELEGVAAYVIGGETAGGLPFFHGPPGGAPSACRSRASTSSARGRSSEPDARRGSARRATIAG